MSASNMLVWSILSTLELRFAQPPGCSVGHWLGKDGNIKPRGSMIRFFLIFALIATTFSCEAEAQQPTTPGQSQTPVTKPAGQPSSAAPAATPPAGAPTATPPAGSPAASPPPATGTPTPQSGVNPTPSGIPQASPQPAAVPLGGAGAAQGDGMLTINDAIRLATSQASAFQQASINEQIAAEDVRQARIAFLPRLTAPLSYIYTTPELNPPAGAPRTQSFIASNAIGEYSALASFAGEIDVSGRLAATLRRNRALLAAAHAGTEVARRALIEATTEAFYGLSLATARRQSAELSLSAAQEFEKITDLLLRGGEVASVDLIRARLQTTQRQDELDRARADEAAAADSLRVLVGYDFARPISTGELGLQMPIAGEIERLTAEMVSRRPEYEQFASELEAARQDVQVARAERRPQLTYTLNGGFDSDSLRMPRLRQHTGASGTMSLSIPIFDFGANRSRVRQAELRARLVESQRLSAVRAFAQQFYTSRSQALYAAARIRDAGAGIAQAQANVNASIARYRSGEAQILEVTDAQTTLATQRAAFFQAIFDYQTARARLRQATGQ